MKLLLELGADPNATNADSSTALLACTGVGALGDGDEAAATEPETLEAVKFLLERGADVNAVDKNGETAMHGAAYQDRPGVMRLLAERGADINVWNRDNKWGWTPWRIVEGHRPGNFRPAPDSIAALKELMLARGVTPPPPKEREGRVQYSDN
jgi:ankyrin repeat protein